MKKSLCLVSWGNATAIEKTAKPGGKKWRGERKVQFCWVWDTMGKPNKGKEQSFENDNVQTSAKVIPGVNWTDTSHIHEVYKYEVINFIYWTSPKWLNTYHLPNLHDIVFWYRTDHPRFIRIPGEIRYLGSVTPMNKLKEREKRRYKKQREY